MSSNSYKVVLLGEGRVGKTSLVARFTKNEFDAAQASTVQAMMYAKKKVQVDDRAVDICVWDTAGQERYHALGPIYYRNANGAMLVYDITDADTFDKVRMWIRELRQVVGDSIRICICGNKGDLERDRAVPQAKADAFAKSEGALHFTTSAKTDMNVSEAFTALAEAVVRSVEGGSGAGATDNKASAGSRGGGAAAGKAGAMGTGPRGRKGVKIDLTGDGDDGASTSPAATSPAASATASSKRHTDESGSSDLLGSSSFTTLETTSSSSGTPSVRSAAAGPPVARKPVSLGDSSTKSRSSSSN